MIAIWQELCVVSPWNASSRNGILKLLTARVWNVGRHALSI